METVFRAFKLDILSYHHSNHTNLLNLNESLTPNRAPSNYRKSALLVYSRETKSTIVSIQRWGWHTKIYDISFRLLIVWIQSSSAWQEAGRGELVNCVIERPVGIVNFVTQFSAFANNFSQIKSVGALVQVELPSQATDTPTSQSSLSCFLRRQCKRHVTPRRVCFEPSRTPNKTKVTFVTVECLIHPNCRSDQKITSFDLIIFQPLLKEKVTSVPQSRD